jgi:lipopolysaccharide transport system ATP-binding protein
MSQLATPLCGRGLSAGGEFFPATRASSIGAQAMLEPSVELRHVSKVYRRGAERANLRAALPGRAGRGSPRKGHWALRDFDFAALPGEIVGIIGPNGAGKSTFLKLLARVIAPTSGSVVTRGRIASLIELGVGFHPDLTGTDNIRFSAAVLGMSREEIARYRDSIVDFAGIGSFMETPVKRYSSGMLARLGFAVASHLHANIVLVDEVLAVGDVDFQRRSFRRMEELRTEGATLLLVTHNLWLVPQICQRALRLEGGRVVDEGDPKAVVERYQVSSAEQPSQAPGHRAGTTIVGFRLAASSIAPHGSLGLEFALVVGQPLQNSRATVVITTMAGFHVAGTDVNGSAHVLSRTGTWSFRGELQRLSLASGDYRVLITVVEEHAGAYLTHAQAATVLTVRDGGSAPQYGLLHLDSQWAVCGDDISTA